MKHAAVRDDRFNIVLNCCRIAVCILICAAAELAGAQVVLPGAGVITTVAGSGVYGNSGNGGQARSAKLGGPFGVAVDGSGNIYISDENYSVVRKVTASSGLISTVAGTGTGGFSGDGGAATSAKIDAPDGLVVDSAGDIFIVDTGNSRVRKVTASSGIITTVAGNGNWGYAGDGRAATSAKLNDPGAGALDSAGNLYIADTGNNVIRKVSAATGTISTVAGNGTQGFAGDTGPATSAELDTPVGLAVDSLGNIYIADAGNSRIREVVASTGIINTIAGNGTQGYTGDNGAATSAALDMPYGVGVDFAGSVYIADYGKNVIRKVSGGTISTFAGNGTAGFTGDGGAATSAELNSPYGVDLDPSGNLYIADYANLRIRVVGTSLSGPYPTLPTITWAAPSSITYPGAIGSQLNATANVAGTFTYSPASGTVLNAGVHALSVIFQPTDTVHYSAAMATVPLTVLQEAPTITWNAPSPIVYGTALSSTQLDATASVTGTFAYSPATGIVLTPGSHTLATTFTPTDSTDYSAANSSVTLVVSGVPGSGIITTVAGNGTYGRTGDGGQAISATLEQPGEIALDGSGNIYIPDLYANVVRKVTASTGIISTIAGTGTSGYSGDGGAATSAKLKEPYAVAVDGSGNVYISDYSNQRIRKVAASNGHISTVAGTGTGGYSGDGNSATSAKIDDPEGLAFDGSGNLYIADSNNGRVRKLTIATGIIATFAGNGNTSYSGDGGAATSAGMSPAGLAFDSAGNLYISDSANNRIRKVAISTGIITTIAGNGTAGYSGDSGSATSAELNDPQGIAVDSSGNVYFADLNNSVIREITSSTGVIATVAGDGVLGYSGDGGPSTSAELDLPPGVALDSSANIFIGDCERVREVGAMTSAPIYVTVAPSSATLYSGQSQQFMATVGNTSNTAVQWSISPAGVGSITSAGVYTAPSTISTQQSVTVTATSQADSTKSSTAMVLLSPPVAVSVSPGAASIYGGQQQTFAASVTNTTNTAVSWTISPTGSGTINSSGVYSAPSTIATQQTVTVTATSQADTSKFATAVITLFPPVHVSVSPSSGSIYSGQTQQFTATVSNATNTSVNWTVSPSSTGYITAAGVYAAPVGITAQQTVTITATSQVDPAKTATSTLTLVPNCASSGFAYERPIIVDHTKVVNSDQTDFPVLFSTTDPLLANVTNGGHVRNSSGYDIIFTSDAAGMAPLDFEIDSYNSTSGAAAFWIRIPTLSHSANSTIYMWYGNASVVASKENKAGVWRNGYAGVWHFGQPTSLSISDSTSNANNAVNHGVSASAGFVGGAGSFDGTGNTYFDIAASNSYKPNSAVTLEAWVNPTSGEIGPSIFSLDYAANGTWREPLQSYSLGTFFLGLNPQFEVATEGNQIPLEDTPGLQTGQWTHLVGTYDGANQILYVNGTPLLQQQVTGPISYGTSRDLAIGAQSPYTTGGGWNGLIDEARISTVARSADWIATEYNNQTSPSTFFVVYPETAGTIAIPTAVSLYAGQYQQFAVTGVCDPGAVVWSMPTGSPGTLTPGGLYVAPSTITSQQTITISGTTLGASSQTYTSSITLEPPISLSVNPADATLYAGQNQQFTANVSNSGNSAVTWTIGPGGTGSISAAGVYTSPSSIASPQIVTVTATTQQVPSQSATATITLLPASSIQISLAPASATLLGGGTQQFAATVSNSANTGVTWIVPSGIGSINSAGLYSAPASVATQQTISVVATSQANTSVSATALVTLSPNGCASNGFGFERAIVVDHTKVANSDQQNFPFLFNTTDASFASMANGGHVSSSNGYDIIFSSDPAGQTRLDFELERYNPATGEVIAWIRIPQLSHSANTVIYVFYGNSNITTSQQNVAGVWDGTYAGVWHLPNGSVLSAADSTANGNNGTNHGATPTAGQVDGGAAFDGSSEYIDLGDPASLPSGYSPRTLCAWAQPTTVPGGYAWTVAYGTPSGSSAMFIGASGTALVAGGYGNDIAVNNFWSAGSWQFVCSVYDGTTASVYGNGQLLASEAKSWNLAPDAAFIGRQVNGGEYWPGTVDEVTISSVARSADWIATEFTNQNSPSTFYSVTAENTLQIIPSAVTLYQGESQQFVTTSACGSGLTWSIPNGAPGTLSSTGLYTAPASVTSTQTVTITATNQAANSITATVTLAAPISVTVAPTSASLTANQTQQFIATVSDGSGVNWTISPAGVGSIDSAGVYQAPSLISTQQTVTVTATSQADARKSASAMVTLSPSTCASSGYGYQRVIVIDHTKVPNTDQTNFPFLFNSTDPDLAGIDHGGHVASSNGYDIIFSTDPAGASKLDHEIEQYDPVTGHLIAWVRVPTLSHSADTVLYLFYGNPGIAGSQQNSAGVWDTNFEAVYHLANGAASAVTDSTSRSNGATQSALSSTAGSIDGGAALNGTSSYIEIPNAAFPNFPVGTYQGSGITTPAATTSFTATVGLWFRTSSPGGLFGQKSAHDCYGLLTCSGAPATVPGDYDVPGGTGVYVGENGTIIGPWGATATAYNDNQWHQATVTFASDGTDTLYVDGTVASIAEQQIPVGYDATYSYFVGAVDTLLDVSGEGDFTWMFLNGSLDEVRVSDIARSGDWIKTEFNNQSSPATFYSLYSASSAAVAPSSVTLYPAQSEQFTVTGTCSSSVNWSIPSGAPGSVTAAGVYRAPNTVSSQQSVTVTATSQTSGGNLGTAVVSLQPSPLPITLTAEGQSPYAVGSTQSFAATLQDADGTPEPNVQVTFTVTGPNSAIGIATTDGNGIAVYSYKGSSSGTDTIVASAVVNDMPLASSGISAPWIAPVQNPTGTVSLFSEPAVGRGGLVGAFTDSDGNVIEPIAIGDSSTKFVTPAGATQLQLGVNDAYYPDNGGAGFVVLVNGAQVTVPPTAMPWTWTSGSLNNNYQYGLGNGTAPVVGASGLTPGQTVAVAYRSGTVSANFPTRPATDANGDSNWVTGVTEWGGAYFPTLYTTGSAYPQGQPIGFTVLATDGTGAPVSNLVVTLAVTGANPGQYQSTTDSSGTAAFAYTGSNAGTDQLQLSATIGGVALQSNEATVTWINNGSPAALGSISLSLFATNGNYQGFVALAKDASGNPVQHANIGFYLSGADSLEQNAETDSTGQAAFVFAHQNAGNFSVVAADSVGRSVVLSAPYNGTWTIPNTGGNNFNAGVGVTIRAPSSVTLPNALTLTGSVYDTVGTSPVLQWSELSGPGTITFANPQQSVTTATFTNSGTYVIQLTASDSGASSSAQVIVSVDPTPVTASSQGLIGSPLNGSTVTGVVPIVLAPGVTLQSGTLVYYPTSNITDVTVLNSNTTGSGQIGTIDTTTLSNGSYWIQMQSTDTTGQSEWSLLLVTVAGNYKPGRVTATVTDLVVPTTGLPISIQRQYDTLNASTSGDFGYGWNLATTVNMSVDPAGDVTFTLGTQRRTFFFTPQPLGFLFNEYLPEFTAEAGMYGFLTESGPGCPALDLLVPDGSSWQCDGGGQFNPPGYIYTDPNGTSYTITANGVLQSMVDRNGNKLTITASGIKSSTGLNVPFVRDSSNRITQITDPLGNQYLYTYDSSGNLSTVTYPNTTQASSYAYDSAHHYTGGTDFRGNALPTTTYFGPTDTDSSGLPLNGRIESVTNALNQTTSYAYDLANNSTTITYPPDGSGAVSHFAIVYDSYGMLLSSTDPLNHTTTNTYDANHNLMSTTDPLGKITSYKYDQNGNRTSVTYPATATSTNTTSATQYNQYSEPTSTTDELGNTRTFSYDGNYNPQSITDSIGTLTSFLFNANGTMQGGAVGYDLTQQPTQAGQFTYDTFGNMTSRTDALGRTTSFTYNNLGQKTSLTIPLPTSSTTSTAATTTYYYDALGHLTETDAPLGRTTHSAYDANGNKISDTDARGNDTTYAYDALNRLITTTYPTQPATTSTKSYDFRNNVIDAIDQAGHDTHYTYDLAGRLQCVTQAYQTTSAAETCYTYDDDGRKLTETDPNHNVTSYTYDSAGNLLSVSGPKGSFQYGYDNARNRVSMTDGNGHTTQYAYDARRRLWKTTYPDSTKVIYAYDGPGNLISVTDQANNVVRYTYDAANQLRSVVQVNSPNTGNNTNNYGFDNNGNLITLTDENGHTTQYSFDLLNEPTGATLPDGSLTESRSYDASGNLLALTHFSGMTTSYAYDALNRLLSWTPDSRTTEPTVSFTYTATGKRHTMTDASGTTTYTYDSLDRPTTKATPEGTLSYTYDAAGNLASMTSGDSVVSVSYQWDSLNRLSTVTDGRLGGTSNITTYTYDNTNNLATATYPNGLQSTFQYDTLNRLTSMTAGTTAAYGYTLGPTGNRTNAIELSGRSITWGFDGIYRLTSETITGDSQYNGGVSYSLDPVGNRLSQSSTLHGIASLGFNYNADDQVQGETYDANGNTTATGGKTFAYDSENHLVSMNDGAVALVYDGDGNRVAKTSSGVTTRYLVDDLNPTGYAQVVEETVNGAANREYTYGLERIDEDQILNNAWTPSFYGYDGFNTVRQLTNLTGAVTDTYAVDAYGNSYNITGSTPNNYLYRGEQWDPDLSLYYLRARWYNPKTGRFLSEDPESGVVTDPATLHKYLYSSGDPVNHRDPSGRDALGETGEVDENLSLGENKELEEIGERVRCIFQATADTLQFAIAPSGETLLQLLPDLKNCSAEAKYKKLQKCEQHHIWPRYLGGPKDGPTASINGLYHQHITNAFRACWPYGIGKPSLTKAKQCLDEVYEEWPLNAPEAQCLP